MLHVLCRIGQDAYAIPGDCVERVLPCASLTAIPGAPVALAGLLNYHGTAVPVVDLCLLLANAPARQLMGTRIVLCHLPASPSGKLGLIVEDVSRTMNLKNFHPSGAEGAECLDGIRAEDGSLIQRISVPAILPPDLLNSLGIPAQFPATS